jgi:conjugative transfer region protein TrbK
MGIHDNLFRRFPLIAMIGFAMVVVAACAIQLHPNDDDPPPPPQADAPDTLATKLETCLTVTPDQAATFEYCRRVWAENRRRFFGAQRRSVPLKQIEQQSQHTTAARKDQSRPPQSGTTPDAKE